MHRWRCCWRAVELAVGRIFWAWPLHWHHRLLALSSNSDRSEASPTRACPMRRATRTCAASAAPGLVTRVETGHKALLGTSIPCSTLMAGKDEADETTRRAAGPAQK